MNIRVKSVDARKESELIKLLETYGKECTDDWLIIIRRKCEISNWRKAFKLCNTEINKRNNITIL